MGKKSIILCDTTVLIQLLRGNEKIKSQLDYLGDERLAISNITQAEIVQGARKRELNDVKEALSLFKKYPLTEEISNIFDNLMFLYAVTHGLRIPDALIAATVLSNNLRLFTDNKQDFTFIPNLKFYNPKF